MFLEGERTIRKLVTGVFDVTYDTKSIGPHQAGGIGKVVRLSSNLYRHHRRLRKVLSRSIPTSARALAGAQVLYRHAQVRTEPLSLISLRLPNAARLLGEHISSKCIRSCARTAAHLAKFTSTTLAFEVDAVPQRNE